MTIAATFVQDDTEPSVVAVLHKKDDPTTPIDLTDCTVVFQMRKADDKRYTVNAVADILDEETGRVEYTWGANDLSQPGVYQAQWQITYPEGGDETTPFKEFEVRRQ